MLIISISTTACIRLVNLTILYFGVSKNYCLYNGIQKFSIITILISCFLHLNDTLKFQQTILYLAENIGKFSYVFRLFGEETFLMMANGY